MKTSLLVLVIVVLLFIYSATLLAVLHPQVGVAYKAYFIEHISGQWEPDHYPSTPEQGIVFARDGLPSWVQFTYGLSSRDGWGRWTDENLDSAAGLVFDRNFSGQLCVDFTTRAVPWVVGKPLLVRMGGQTHSLRVDRTDLTRYQVQFTNLPPTDRVELVIPERLPKVVDVTPTNGDTRRVALALNTLRIRSGACPVS